MVLGEGLEPSRLTAPEPKSGVSANFTTRADGKSYVCSVREQDVNSVGWQNCYQLFVVVPQAELGTPPEQMESEV